MLDQLLLLVVLTSDVKKMETLKKVKDQDAMKDCVADMHSIQLMLKRPSLHPRLLQTLK
jgi:hypothetical protein